MNEPQKECIKIITHPYKELRPVMDSVHTVAGSSGVWNLQLLQHHIPTVGAEALADKVARLIGSEKHIG
jgi:hypothetical protein